MTDYEYDSEFLQMWDSLEPVFRLNSNKRDAQYFWLQGRKLELEKRQLFLDELQREVADARGK